MKQRLRWVLVGAALLVMSALTVYGFIPNDADGDGVPDPDDLCPAQNSSLFDRNGDGCIDTFVGARHIEYWGAADNTITYVINDIAAPNIVDGSDITAVQSAVSAWTSIPDAELNVVYGGTTVQTDANALDRINLVTFLDQDYPFSAFVLAVGLSTSFEGDTLIDGRVFRKGEIFDTDMVFNPHITFKTGAGIGIDIQSVATHEAGHLFGISHTAVQSSTMFYVLPGGNAARTLAADDRLVYFKAYGTANALAAANRIEGTVTNGATLAPVPGAIVYIINSVANDTTTCDFTLPNGSFSFPGLPDGSYYVSIHPLDGTSPIGYIQPGNINALVQETAQTVFVAESYDAAESNADDANARTAVTVNAGSQVANASIVTNIDGTPPTVTKATPANNSVGVFIDGAYVIEMSEPIDVSTLSAAFSFRDDLTAAAKGGSLSIIRDDSVIVYTPSPPLEFGKAYTLRLDTDLKDRFGNAIASDFTLHVVTETEPTLSIASLRPAKGVPGATVVISARGVDPGATVTFNNQAATVLSSGPNRVVVSVPNAAQTGSVVVTNPGNEVSNALVFTVLSDPDLARGYDAGQVLLASTPRAIAVTPSGDYAYVATDAGATAIVVGPSLPGYLTSELIPFPHALNDLASTPTGTRMYAISGAGKELVEIMSDPTTGLLFNTVLSSRSLGATPLGIAVDPTGRRAFIATDEEAVQVWDIQLGSPTYQKQVGVLAAPNGVSMSGALAVTPAGDKLLAATEAGTLAIYTIETSVLDANVSVGIDPRGIGIDPQGSRAYVSHDNGDISVVSISGNAFQVQDIGTGGSLRGLAVTPAGKYVYTAVRGLNKVDIVDLEETHATFRTVVSEIDAATNPIDVAMAPDGGFAFSAIQGDGTHPARVLVTVVGVGPALECIAPPAATVGAQMVLSGSQFLVGGMAASMSKPRGASAAFSQLLVDFNGVLVVPDSYTLNVIQVAVPADATSGPVRVRYQASPVDPIQNSNAVFFEVLEPSGPDDAMREVANIPDPTGGQQFAPAVAMRPQGDLLFVGGQAGSIFVYDIRPGSPTFHHMIDTFYMFDTVIYDIAITPDGKNMCVTETGSTNDIEFISCDPNDPGFGSVHSQLAVGNASLTRCAASPDNQLFAVGVGSLSQVYMISDFARGETPTIAAITPITGLVTDIVFHPTSMAAYVATTGPQRLNIIDSGQFSPNFGFNVEIQDMPGPGPKVPMSVTPMKDGTRVQVLAMDLASSLERSIVDFPVQTYGGISLGVPTEYGLEFGSGGAPFLERARLSPRGDRAVRNGQYNIFFLYDTADPTTHVGVIGGGSEALAECEFEFTPDATRLYIANRQNTQVRVYDFSIATSIQLTSGDDQEGVVDQVLPAPLRVRVLNDGGAPVGGVPLMYAITEGGGKFIAGDEELTIYHTSTGPDGYAEATWKLGAAPGTNHCNVTAVGLDGFPIFAANANVNPDLLPLSVAEVIPINNSTDISATTAVLATFSRSVDPLTISGVSLFVRVAADATLIPVTFGFSDDNRRVSLTPGAPLAHSETYQVVLTGAIHDDSAGALTNPGSTSFTTQAPPPARIASAFPPSALRGVRVTISGVGFDPTPSDNTVSFNGALAIPTGGDASQLLVTVPIDATTGPVSVHVGAQVSNTTLFTVLAPNTSPIDEVIASVGTGSGVRSCALTPDGALCYTVSPDGDVVIPVDVAGLTSLPHILVGDNPVAIIVNPEGTFAYVANFNSGTVSVIDVDSDSPDFNTVVATITVEANPVDLVALPDGSRVVVVNAGSSTLSVVDGDQTSATYRQVIASVGTGSTMKSVAVSPDGARIFVGTDTGYLVVGASSYSVVASVGTGSGAKSLALSPDGTLLFILTTDGTVLIVNVVPGSTSENEVIASVGTGSTTKSLAISADGALLYLIQEDSDEVIVVSISIIPGVGVRNPDGAAPSFTVATAFVDTVETGADPTDVAFDPSGSGGLFITNAGDGTLTILNTSDVPFGPIAADVIVDPNVPSVATDGRYISGRIELPGAFPAGAIKTGTVRLDSSLPASSAPPVIEDSDHDGIDELVLKFDRAAFQALVPQGPNGVTIDGGVSNRLFSGEDNLTIARPEITHPGSGEQIAAGQNIVITFDAPPAPVQKYDIHFSSNDGATWQPVALQITGTSVAWFTPFVESQQCRVLVTAWNNGAIVGRTISQDPFTVMVPTAVRLKSFDARIEDGDAVLRWETSFEAGMNGFELARAESEDGLYATINGGRIDAKGSEGSGGSYEVRDATIRANHAYWYKLREVTSDGLGAEFGPYTVTFALVNGLEQNVPNPFNPTTTIKYAIAQDANVSLVVYDVAGRRVRALVNEKQRADVYRVAWDGINDSGERVASGMYFYRLVAGKYTQTRKMMLLK